MNAPLALLISGLLLSPLAAAEKPVIAVYDLEDSISEGGQASSSLLGLSFDTSRPLTHFDLVQSLEKAAADDNLKAVVLEVDQAGMGLAQLQELRRLLLAIRAAEKDVWLYTESLSPRTALLGSAANHFVLMPEGDVNLTGYYAESLYFKGLLDKLGIEVDVVHIGDFKSAGETFYREGPSEPAAKQSAQLYDAFYQQLLTLVSEGRKIEKAALEAFINSGFRTPEQAREAGLLDDLQYRTDFIATVREQYGEDALFDRGYELPDLDGPEMDSMLDVFSLMFSSGKSKRFRTDYIAVVTLDSDITDASIAPVRTEVLKAARNDKCRGMVLRVNSPGGSALASEVLWEATDEFTATKKPWVVSMGGVAASGGYYIAAGAPLIFAEEGTITGSIGVVGMKFALGGAMEMLGITSHEFKRGEHADIMNTNRPFSEAERTLVTDSMLDIYGTFKKRITDGRGDRLKGDLESLAGGRVYSGTHALEIGLVDKIGGLQDAIAHVAREAGLENAQAHLLPEPADPFAGLFSSPSSDDEDDEFIRATTAKPAAHLRQFLLLNPAYQALDHGKQASLRQLADRLEAFQDNRILLLAPELQAP
ncbi:MAG: signal peptide peptidase SppA [Verrucomicrobia bacterium]|nr:signal peptide peptidase SppA [Verrucomicrobiota bacterium]